MNSPTLDVYKDAPHWSFSSLNTLLNICSLQWKFKYIDKLEPETMSVCLPFGVAFHEGMSTYMQSIKDKNPDVELGVETFRTDFTNRIDNDPLIDVCLEERNELLLKGENMIRVAAENYGDPMQIIDIGHAFSVDIPGSDRKLIGEFDLVVRDDKNKLIVVDWKTSASRWALDKADKDFQATLYSYAVSELIGTIPLFRYDVVTKTKTPSFTPFLTERSWDDFKRAFKMIHTAERIVKNELFYPNEGCFSCASCPYGNECRKWQRN